MNKFALHAGCFVRVKEDVQKFKKGEVLQVLSTGTNFTTYLTFVGVNQKFPKDLCSRYLETIAPDDGVYHE